MNTLTANSTIATPSGSDFWTDFIARLESWFEATPAKSIGVAVTAAPMTIAEKAAERRFRREMAMLESCQ